MRLLTLMLLLLSLPVLADYAKVISDTDKDLIIEVKQVYILGDGDTRIDARNIALQEAKVKAAELSGSYVEAERVIQDDEIKSETIKTISTALMKTKVKSESFSITNTDQMQLELTIVTELDKKSILNKLGLLKEDTQKLQQMAQIQAENTRLQEELNSLNNQLAQLKRTQQTSDLQTKPRQELVQRRDEVFAEIERNQNSISAIFNQGTLFSMAKKSNQEFNNAKKDIDVNVWEYIVNNTQIMLGEPDFIQNSNGSYNIRIEVKWKVEGEPLLKTLNKYFKDYNESSLPSKINLYRESSGRTPGTKIEKSYNTKENQLKAYTSALYEYLLTKKIAIIVNAGRYNQNIFIAAPRSCFVSCSGIKGDTLYHIHFNNLEKPSETMHDENPVIIKNIPKEVLENLTSIDAKVVLQ